MYRRFNNIKTKIKIYNKLNHYYIYIIDTYNIKDWINEPNNLVNMFDLTMEYKFKLNLNYYISWLFIKII